MENKELNLVEILKDCPKGTELYSTVCGNVTLYGVNEEVVHEVHEVKVRECEYCGEED